MTVRFLAGKKKTAVFLDRDGTLNFDPGYLSKAEGFKFLPRVKHALRLLSKNGLALFVVSNQSGIGRGLIHREDLKKIHRRMTQELKKDAIALEGIFVCPHSPQDRCDCRKPSPKMILDAARRHGLNTRNSYMVGDKMTDVETGWRAGLQTVLIADEPSESPSGIKPDHVARDLFGAAKWIIKRHKMMEDSCRAGSGEKRS